MKLAIGIFDTFHKGHLEVLKNADAVLTFFPPLKKGNYILPLSEKISIFRHLGIKQYFIYHPFSYIYSFEPSQFLKYLKELGVKTLIVGEDFTFGKNKLGNIQFLRKNIHNFGISLKIIPEIKDIDNKKISSSIIKKLILEHKFDTLKIKYNYQYYISGIVEKGHQIGRKIGIKTANLSPKKHQIIPPTGVYITKTYIDSKNNGLSYNSITYIGKGNVLKNEKEIKIETHLLNVDINLYGRKIYVFFKKFYRKELKNIKPEELINKIKEDIAKYPL